jgi:hypothetical protein
VAAVPIVSQTKKIKNKIKIRKLKSSVAVE